METSTLGNKETNLCNIFYTFWNRHKSMWRVHIIYHCWSLQEVSKLPLIKFFTRRMCKAHFTSEVALMQATQEAESLKQRKRTSLCLGWGPSFLSVWRLNKHDLGDLPIWFSEMCPKYVCMFWSKLYIPGYFLHCFSWIYFSG